MQGKKKLNPERPKYFSDDWLELDEYKDWLRKVNDDETKYRCAICRKNLSLSSSGKSALKIHESGEAHRRLSKSKKLFFKPKGETAVSTNEGSSKQATLYDTSIVTKDIDLIKAQVIWLLKSVDSGFSTRSSDDIVDCFKAMFPDSKIAQSIKMKKDKASYIMNYGLAPHFKDMLMSSVNKSDVLVVSFDESLNKKTQKGEMVVMIRYWDIDECAVKCRYLGSSFMGHGREKDLHKHLNNITSCIDNTKVYQISMDGPAVNHKFFRNVVKDRNRNLVHSLVDIGTCNLHIVAGSLKTGTEKTTWNLSKTLKGSYQIFHDSPARREDYEEVTGSNTYPKFFCATRWVENKDVAERLLAVWPDIKKLFSWWSGQKGRQPCDTKTKSMDNVKAGLADGLTEAKLHFFSYVTGKLEPFLKKYQTEKPMIVFMYRDLKVLVKGIMKMFVKSNVVSKASKSTKHLLGIDLHDNDNLLSLNEIDIGFSADSHIRKLKQQDEITSSQIKSFKTQCQSMVIGVLEKLFERSPLDSNLLRSAGVFAPSFMVSLSKQALQKSMKSLLTELLDSNIISTMQGDKALEQFSSFLDIELEQHKEKFERFCEKEMRLDQFYFVEIAVHKKYAELSFIMRLLFTLSHGQADVERDFSLRKNLEQHNTSPETIISKRRIKDHLTSNKLAAFQVPVDKPLVLAVKDARRKWIQHLDDEVKKKEISDAENEKLKASKEKAEAILQLDRDMQVMNAGLSMAEKAIEEGSKELGVIVKKKNSNKEKLMEVQSKIEMGLKRKSELKLEVEVLAKKRKLLIDDK